MNETTFDALLHVARAKLGQKQRALRENYKLGEYPRWWFDQETATLQFLDNEDKVQVVFDFIDIGSFSVRSRTWQWAWSNPSVSPHIRRDSEVLKSLADATENNIFAREDIFDASESMAWDFAAMAIMHLSALGCYRAPASENSLFLFLALTKLHVTN